jgi:hypothetical protein
VTCVPKYPDDIQSAHTGEVLPIPKVPAGVKFKPGDRCPLTGKADFYRMRYGPYLIGMNMTKDKLLSCKYPEAPTLHASSSWAKK